MEVVRIEKRVCEEFVSKKHYSRKPSIFWAGFGLIENEMIQGVAVYGQPSPPIQKHAFRDRDFKLFELSRVVIQTKTRNAGSLLIGRSLRMLNPPCCAVVSYSDMEQNHCGILYQSTNWTYTGATTSHDSLYIVDGERVHPMTLRDRGITNPAEWAKANGIERVQPSEKHRYFQFVGSKTEVKMMRGKLQYGIVTPYPKCDQARYDDGPMIDVRSGEKSKAKTLFD